MKRNIYWVLRISTDGGWMGQIIKRNMEKVRNRERGQEKRVVWMP